MGTQKPKNPSPSRTDVSGFLSGLDHPHKNGIEQLRALILGLDERVSEEVKWNAPSFKLDDHFATFKLHPPKGVQLVLHTGAKKRSDAKKMYIEDPDGLLKWAAADRCVLTLGSAADLAVHRASVLHILEQWVSQL